MATPRIVRLRLGDFRSYAALDLACDAAVVALCGENGAGKTNLLEAVSLLSPGRGLRRAAPEAIARAGGPGGFTIAADVRGDGGDVRLGVSLTQGDGGGLQRVARRDGTTVGSAAAFADVVRVVWLTPDLDGLFRGPAGDRRRFLDRMTLSLDPGHAARVAALERALRARNRLLEDVAPDPAWLDALEREAAELGVAVASARAETVARLRSAIAAARDDGSPFPWAKVALGGEIDALAAGVPAIAAEEAYRRRLREMRAADRAAGRALVGPQASDLLVRHGPKDLEAGLASTGEQKALLIGLVLAHARLTATMTGLAPVMLLDEAAAHLDPRRRAALFAALGALGSQIWLTGADPALFAGLGPGAARFIVTPGQVGAAPASG